jgi:16S rRNA pseudouridine516 synthase
MQSKRTRLDRFISQHTQINRKDVRLLLAQGRIEVDGAPATDIHQLVDEFTQVSLDEKNLQAKQATYLMLHKSIGVVSATKDPKHPTVLDLIVQVNPEMAACNLHIAGRLDFNTSGLLLLTNDGRWSRGLSSPEQQIAKRYIVQLANPISEDYISAFAEGMHFPFENITTRPAQLKILEERLAEVHLTEGRYHQIKRMFGRFRNPVIGLHRTAIGSLELDPALPAGHFRPLSPTEVASLS